MSATCSRVGRGRRCRPALGVTLVEIMACLLLLVIGCMAVLGLILYGIALSERAQQAATGLQTARTVLADASPIGMLDRSESGGIVTGYINGYFVRRTIVAASDLASSGNAMQVATVTAEVFLARNGTPIASLQERQLRVSQP